MTYSFIDHLHNFAVWTAARAVQRGFTTTKNIRRAINKTDLKDFATNKWINNPEDFDVFHRQTANAIINYLKKIGIETTYGQAAKIIGIYLKTTVVIPDKGISVLSKIVHPPIDNILLTNLSKTHKGLELSSIKWTQLNEKNYFKLIDKLRTLQLDSFWLLEKHWTANG